MADSKDNKNQKDRLFFHDLINQTHGMMLFLSQKNSLSCNEIDSLKNEIKLLQELVQNHYTLVHKNLEETDAGESQYQKVKSSLEKLITLYHPNSDGNIKITISGEEKGLVDFIPLYRMLNNIVKNMAEAKISQAEYRLSFGPYGLTITTQNKWQDKKNSSNQEGLGLMSISTLASDAGGTFQHGVHNGNWVNHIFLPYKKVAPILRIAA